MEPMKKWKMYIDRHQEEEVTAVLVEAGYTQFYIEEPIKQTITHDGYGFQIESNEDIILYYVPNEKDSMQGLADLIGIRVDDIEEEEEVVETDPHFQDQPLPNGWKIVYPPFEHKQSEYTVKLDPQGAFGTGEHGTSRDALTMVLDMNLIAHSVADIGTGSGILAVGAALKGARVDAYDIEPVTREVYLQAALNQVEDKIHVFEGDIFSYDHAWSQYEGIMINIGASTTMKWLEREGILKDKSVSFILISGIVDWAYDEVFSMFKESGWVQAEHKKSSEWHTMLFIPESVEHFTHFGYFETLDEGTPQEIEGGKKGKS